MTNTLRKLDLLLQSAVKLCQGVHIRLYFPQHTQDTTVGMQFIPLMSKEWQEVNLFDLLDPCGPQYILKQEKLRPGLHSSNDLRSNLGSSRGGKGKEQEKRIFLLQFKVHQDFT